MRADCFALTQIQKYQDGKLLLWAWVSRGLVTMEQLAELRFAGDVEQAKSFFKATPGELAKIWRLDDLPELDIAEREAAVEEASRTALSGEVNRSWIVQDTWAARKP